MPNWLNGWIKLNNKHVVHRSGADCRDKEKRSAPTASTKSPSTLTGGTTTARRRSWTSGRKKDDFDFTRQVLNEAAFMSEPHDHPRVSPEGLVVSLPEEQRAELSSHFKGFASMFTNDQERCKDCKKLKQELQCVCEDLEYMRGIAVQQGAHTDQCACSSCRPATATTRTVTAGQDFTDLIDNHKRILEELAIEKEAYQLQVGNERHEYQSIVQKLSSEADRSKKEVIALNQQLDAVVGERDALSIENLHLQAQLISYTKQKEEHSKLKRRYVEYEENGIKRAVEQVDARDRIIDDLSSKLERTLDMLVKERGNRRQNIILPIDKK